VDLVGIVTQSVSPVNADFRSLEDLGRTADVPVIIAEGNEQAAMADFLRETGADIVYCFGWSYLLGAKVLAAAPRGVIGFHPAALPANKGRHPLIWALALGLHETASSFFFMDEGADSGDIIDQMPLIIGDNDDAATLYAKMSETACGQLTRITAQLSSGTEIRKIQDHQTANTWRKRGPSDGAIDWRMSADAIYNLVRALTRPYVGAHCVFQGQEIKVWRVEPNFDAPDNMEPGKVLSAKGDVVEIKCADGSIRLVEHEFSDIPQPGNYL
jgi:methionyl-tRNA formyltransferase